MNGWLERLFLLLIASLGFMRPSIGFEGMALQASEILFASLAVVLSIAIALRRRSIEWDRSYFFFGAFALAMALSAAFSIQPRNSAIKLTGIVYLVGLAIAAFNLVTSVDAVRRLVLVWIATSSLVSLIAAVTVVLFYIDRDSAWHGVFLHHYGSLPIGNYPRVHATFLYPAMLCNYLSVGALFLLGAWKAGWVRGWLTAATLSLHGIAAIFTLTPGFGGFVAILAIWAGSLLFDKGRRGRGILWVCVGIAAVVASTAAATLSIWAIETSPYTFQVLGARLDPTQRLLAWQESARTFAIDPIFGKGLGMDVASVRFRAPSGQMQMLTDAHNTGLSVAAQTGVIGLIAIVALCAYVLRRGWSFAKPSSSIDWISRAAVIAFLGGFVLQSFVGSFEDARHLWVLMGITLALRRIAPASSEA